MQDVNHQLFTESVREEVALSLRNRAEGPLRGEAAESEIEAVLAGLGLTDLVDQMCIRDSLWIILRSRSIIPIPP